MTTATTIKVQFQVRQDTAANWTSVNPVLLAGELGRETDTGKIKIGNGSSVWSNLAYQPFGGQITNADISATAEIAVSKLADGTARQLLQTDAAGTDVEWTDNVDVPGTLDVTGAATFDDDVTIQGDLTVNGTTTTIDTTTLVVEDKNIEIGKVATPTDVTADGGGITLKGDTDKTINWVDATDAWTLSEHVDIASGKEYRIAGTKVLDATSLGSAVVSSSLTSVGTIGTGVWNGTTVATGYGGTGQTTYTDGELLIGKTDGTLAKATITAGTGVTVTNGDGSITIDATGTGLPTTGGTLTGDLTLNAQSDVRWADADSSNWVAFQAPATVASNVTWTLPNADGSADQVLKTDGSGNLGWVSAGGGFTATVTATSKTITASERCTVTASGQTITLPASPSAGDEVTVTIAGTFTDTIIDRNGLNIMSLAEDLTVDKANVSVTLYYVDATRGWRIM